MSKGTTSQPASVDPQALAAAQTSSNVQTAETQSGLNNISTNSPYGSSTFAPGAIDPTTGLPSSYTLNQSLSPQLQPLFDQGVATAQGSENSLQALQPAIGSIGVNAAGLASGTPVQTSLNFGAVPGATSSGTMATPTAFSGTMATPTALTSQTAPQAYSQLNPAQTQQEVTQAQNAAYNTQEQYLQPQQAEQTAATTQQLADQGLQPGTAAYDQAMGDLTRSQTFANQGAQNAAVTAGNQEQNTLFGQNLSGQAQTFGQQLGAQQQEYNQGAGNFGLNLGQQQQAYNQQAGNFGLNLGQQQQAYGQNLSSEQQAANQTLQQGQFTNAAQGQLINQAIGAFGSLGSYVNPASWAQSLPTTMGSTGVTAPNLAATQSAANTANMNSFNSGMALNNQLFGGLGSVAGAIGGASPNSLFGSIGSSIGGALGLGAAAPAAGSVLIPGLDTSLLTGAALF